jgi:TRAP-type C4-dicarboxylate transport system permease small subunit
MTACAVVAGFLLFALMWLICVNAFSRKLLNAPVVGTLELTEAIMPFVILLPMAFTQFRRGHIRVTLLTRHIPFNTRHILHIAAFVIGGIFFCWVAWATAGFAMRAWNVGETAWGLIRIPLWPTKWVISIGAMLLAGQFFLDALKLGLYGTEEEESEMTAVAAEEREALDG